mmetsp:Transcript_4347/g.10894  ORF Transcript_4347/g.10894 Transcript_4347/m.10894 type:complete len:215 (-) Transcript_4347:212-856(-)
MTRTPARTRPPPTLATRCSSWGSARRRRPGPPTGRRPRRCTSTRWWSTSSRAETPTRLQGRFAISSRTTTRACSTACTSGSRRSCRGSRRRARRRSCRRASCSRARGSPCSSGSRIVPSVPSTSSPRRTPRRPRRRRAPRRPAAAPSSARRTPRASRRWAPRWWRPKVCADTTHQNPCTCHHDQGLPALLGASAAGPGLGSIKLSAQDAADPSV